MKAATHTMAHVYRNRYALTYPRCSGVLRPRPSLGREPMPPLCRSALCSGRKRGLCSGREAGSDASAKFAPLAEAASVPFPGRSSRVSRVGFGSPWMGAAADRSLQMSRALGDGRCNLVQLTSEVKRIKKNDKTGKPLLIPEWPERSWETRTLKHLDIPREDVCLLWELPAAGEKAEEALNPARAMEQLEGLLEYHELTYIDAFIMEIPCMKKGSDVSEYRRHMGLGVRRAMTDFMQQAQDRVKALGFSWKSLPHVPYPDFEPDSPLSDVVELRDILMPGKPIVAMFPIGLGSGICLDGLGSSNQGILGLPTTAGVLQIGTQATHMYRHDGRPFRMVDVRPRPIEEIMPELKSAFGMTVHLEMEYAKRFESGDRDGGEESTAGRADGDDTQATSSPASSPLPPKADVSWGQILAQNQGKLQGLDEWEAIRDSQIKPTVNRALDTLRIRGDAESEWGFVYRSTLGSLMTILSEVMEVRKAGQLEEAVALMDELCPSLKQSPERSSDANLASNEVVAALPVVEQCVAAALATGVDCVLDEEFSASRQASRVEGFKKVPPEESKKLLSDFRLPE